MKEPLNLDNSQTFNEKIQWLKLYNSTQLKTKLAEILATGFSLVRVDFYDIANHIYFGEMTFTSMSGTGKFEPEYENFKLGQKIKLPEKNKEYTLLS